MMPPVTGVTVPAYRHVTDQARHDDDPGEEKEGSGSGPARDCTPAHLSAHAAAHPLPSLLPLLFALLLL
eukprot:1777399-Rhodomonas_salina.1